MQQSLLFAAFIADNQEANCRKNIQARSTVIYLIILFL